VLCSHLITTKTPRTAVLSVALLSKRLTIAAAPAPLQVPAPGKCLTQQFTPSFLKHIHSLHAASRGSSREGTQLESFKPGYTLNHFSLVTTTPPSQTLRHSHCLHTTRLQPFSALTGHVRLWTLQLRRIDAAIVHHRRPAATHALSSSTQVSSISILLL